MENNKKITVEDIQGLMHLIGEDFNDINVNLKGNVYKPILNTELAARYLQSYIKLELLSQSLFMFLNETAINFILDCKCIVFGRYLGRVKAEAFSMFKMKEDKTIVPVEQFKEFVSDVKCDYEHNDLECFIKVLGTYHTELCQLEIERRKKSMSDEEIEKMKKEIVEDLKVYISESAIDYKYQNITTCITDDLISVNDKFALGYWERLRLEKLQKELAKRPNAKKEEELKALETK